MNIHEFRNLAEREISNENYTILEAVYAHHPSIDEVIGKNQIAKLYDIGGMALIHDMLPRAERAEQIKNEIIGLRGRIEILQDELMEMKK